MVVLGDKSAGLGEGIPDRGEVYRLPGLATGLPVSSFFLDADAAAVLTRPEAVSWRGLFTGLFVDGVSGRNSLLEAYGSAVAGRGGSGFLVGLRAAPDIKEPGRAVVLAERRPQSSVNSKRHWKPHGEQ